MELEFKKIKYHKNATWNSIMWNSSSVQCVTKFKTLEYHARNTSHFPLPTSHCTHTVNNSTHIVTIIDLRSTHIVNNSTHIATIDDSHSTPFYLFYFLIFSTSIYFFFSHWLPVLFLILQGVGFSFFFLLLGSREMEDKLTIMKR